MVVEDEVLIRLAISEDLREAGFKVVEAGTADQALGYLTVNPPVAVVFSDVRVPGSMNGVEFMRVVQARFPAIKVLLTSGHLSAAIVDEGTP